MLLADVPRPQIELLLGQHHDRTPFRRLVGERRQLRSIGKLRLRHVRRRNERAGHAVAERNGARLVEQQHVHVARGLDGASAHGHDVALQDAIHPRDADGAQTARRSSWGSGTPATRSSTGSEKTR